MNGAPIRHVTRTELLRLVSAALEINGLAADSSSAVAHGIVQAEMDGSRSHGLQRVPGYLSSLSSGWVNGAARPAIEDRPDGVVAIDARNGFAQVASAFGRDLLISKARRLGVAMMLIHNSHHFGALWPDVEPLAEQGLLAIAMVNSRSRIVAWGGQSKVLGTNPLAFACPRRGRSPLVWDQASSLMSQGDLLLHAAAGTPVPPEVGVDSSGFPTTDAKSILDGGALLPFSGPKGASIAFMVEILAAALTGGRFGFEDSSASVPGALTSHAGQFILAIDPAIAGPSFDKRVEGLIAALVSAGSGRMPGDNRYRRRQAGERDGFDVDATMLRTIEEAAGTAGTA